MHTCKRDFDYLKSQAAYVDGLVLVDLYMFTARYLAGIFVEFLGLSLIFKVYTFGGFEACV